MLHNNLAAIPTKSAGNNEPPAKDDPADDTHEYPSDSLGEKIEVKRGELHTTVDKAERALAKTGKYFDSGGSIVAVCTDSVTGSAIIRPVTANTLTLLLSRHCKFFRETEQGVSFIDPPQRHVSILHDCSEFHHLPPLTAVSLQPFLRGDGTLVTKQGYDKTSQTYGYFDPSDYSIKENPTREDAQESLELLLELLSEFEYEHPHDKAAALSMMLTAAVRPSLPTAPIGHVKAHAPGSGKGYQCELIGCFASPSPVEAMPFPTNDTDCRKELLAYLMQSPSVLIFDNLTTDIVAHDSLCLAVTSEKMTGRVLGVSKMATVSTRCLILTSGNNVGPVNDMVRRTLQISLSPKTEQPAERKFKQPDLVPFVRKNRGKYVSAALTVVLAYLRAGCPRINQRPLNSFGDWSRLCRCPLIWLGQPDPATATLNLMSENPGRMLVGQLIEEIYSKYKSKPFTVKQLVQTADGTLLDLIETIAADDGETVNRRSLGWWLANKVGHIVDGKRIMRVDQKSPARYEVQALTTQADDYRAATDGK